VKNIILALLLFQNSPQPVGVVTGVVNGPNGMPASGVRVFAIEAREGIAPAKTSLALESISVTDDKGRYRLEIATGRYYIASGSVESPTYSPGTPDIAAAREVRVTAGTVVTNVDFSSFIPAARRVEFDSQFALPPGSTGVLGGVLRYADGTPASGIVITAVPSPLSPATVSASPNSVIQLMARFRTLARSDANGRYRINNVAPGTYIVAAGSAETPEFYPGTSDIQAAKSITTTPTTNLDMLDFTVSARPNGMRVSGRVTASGQVPALGAMLRIRSLSTVSQSTAVVGLPSRLPQNATLLDADGRFEYLDVPPGEYALEAVLSGVPPLSRNIAVRDQPLADLELSIPIAVFSGSIVWEDGSALPSPQSFGEAIVTTVNNSSFVTSIMMPISPTGIFERPMEADEYRFHVRNLPEGYAIQSITSDGKDLLKETVKVGNGGRVNVEIRVRKKTKPEPGEIPLSGKALDAVTGAPVAAELVTICCRDAGVAERFSTPLSSDGSFEFKSIPPGHYDVGLQVASGRPNLFVVDSRVDVGNGGVSGLEILSAQRFISVMAFIANEAGGHLDAGSSASVVFVGTLPSNRVTATQGDTGAWSALLPGGDIYTVTVENLPTGYSVKSTSGPIDFRTYVPVVNSIGAPPPDPVARITLTTP
jgi:hypothetical protein